MNWGPADFLLALILLTMTGLSIMLAAKKIGQKYRKWAFIAIVCLLILVWAELGVGVFGSVVAGD